MDRLSTLCKSWPHRQPVASPQKLAARAGWSVGAGLKGVGQAAQLAQQLGARAGWSVGAGLKGVGRGGEVGGVDQDAERGVLRHRSMLNACCWFLCRSEST